MNKRQILKLYHRAFVQSRKCSSQTIKSFEDDFVEHHIPINFFQRTILTVRLQERQLKYMLGNMEESEEGTRILNERPRINTHTIDVDYLKKLPDETLGKTYSNFLEKNKVTPDSRMTVQFIDDIQLAYVIQRYREAHDLVHTVLQMPTHMLGEVTVKWVEAIQTRLPMCIGGAIFGPVRLKPKHRQLYVNHYLPWALKTGINAEFLMNVYFEKRWEQPLSEFYEEVNIEPLVLKERQKKSDKKA
ncbi:hypothetical protein NQ318_020602 [Aromia moschata]|uniref:Ubiquinone biosynthesis protein COQ4 homolog, mitochondrial n=1 Tax=Aromia moschata TaxID=1265417 RepID=A0AAV8Z0P2_9CUCU|nr:hypothetical protein NQ318_020602 [Aromia moschata]